MCLHHCHVPCICEQASVLGDCPDSSKQDVQDAHAFSLLHDLHPKCEGLITNKPTPWHACFQQLQGSLGLSKTSSEVVMCLRCIAAGCSPCCRCPCLIFSRRSFSAGGVFPCLYQVADCWIRGWTGIAGLCWLHLVAGNIHWQARQCHGISIQLGG